MNEITVHTMGVYYRWKMPDQVREQLWLAHSLREDLVSLHHDHEQNVRDIWSSFPSVASAEAERDAADAAASAVAEQVKAERVRQRSKRVTGPLAEQLRAARKRVRDARQARRDAIAAVKDDADTQLREASDRQRAAQKQLYAQYCQSGRLYWATFNDVLDHHKTAVKRVAAHRKQGKPAQLKHHRFDGSGSIGVQLQRQTGQPPRTPAMIADADHGKWRNVFTVPWTPPDMWDTMSRAQQRKSGRTIARMRCGADADGNPAWVEIPVQQHRMLPADADITGARLTFRRVAGQLKGQLSVTAKIGAPQPVTSGPAVAIHLGWRDSDAGTVVAHWRSDQRIDVPHDLRHVMTIEQSHQCGSIVIPHQIPGRLDIASQIASQRSVALDTIREQLVTWLRENGPQPHPTRDGESIEANNVALWRNPARFAHLAQHWRTSDDAALREIGGSLEAWRSTDRRLWEAQAHGRAKTLRHRDDLYRQIGALIAGQAGVVVVDDTSIADIASRATDLPNEVESRIARRRAAASPGLLRSAIVAAAERDGLTVHTVDHQGLSRIHARCGHENPLDDRYMDQIVTCDGCGDRYDQDRSATVLMLARASGVTAS